MSMGLEFCDYLHLLRDNQQKVAMSKSFVPCMDSSIPCHKDHNLQPFPSMLRHHMFQQGKGIRPLVWFHLDSIFLLGS